MASQNISRDASKTLGRGVLIFAGVAVVLLITAATGLLVIPNIFGSWFSSTDAALRFLMLFEILVLAAGCAGFYYLANRFQRVWADAELLRRQQKEATLRVQEALAAFQQAMKELESVRLQRPERGLEASPLAPRVGALEAAVAELRAKL